MGLPEGYVELNRRFRISDGTQRPDELAERSYLPSSHGRPGEFGWEELLQKKLVVIQGEAGSGKSWEFRGRHDALQKHRQHSFLIELERVVTGTVKEVLSPGDFSQFIRWQKSDAVAYFFLDSADEAKTGKESDLYVALEKIRDTIGPAAIARAHIFISTRYFEWQPITDRDEVNSRLAAIGHNDKQGQVGERHLASIVKIDPLGAEQVKKLVEARASIKSDAFLQEVESHFAWEFVRTPLDVADLFAFWMSKGRLGSLTEVIEYVVSSKLRETVLRQKKSDLSEGRAREGAESLAAATILCKQQEFKIPDQAFAASNALDAMACLPVDWKPAEMSALLSRSLFDSPTYGQVRFCHRRFAEYLAAQWLQKQMAKGYPISECEQLLFSKANSTRVPRYGLIPIIAWLCIGDESWNDAIRSWVLEGAPEIHFEFGDAGALPTAFKQALLSAWINKNNGRKSVWVRSVHISLRRLACPEIVDDVSAFLIDASIADDVREELVQLVRYGVITDCLPSLLRILDSSTESDVLKCYVLATLRDVGTYESCQRAWEILQPTQAYSDRMCSLTFETLYPKVIGPAEAVGLLRRTGSSLEQSIDLPWGIERHIGEFMPASDSGMMLEELNRLVQTGPHVFVSDEETRISAHFVWVLDVIPTVLAKLLSKDSLTATECNDAAESVSLLAESHNFPDRFNELISTLDAATHNHPGVRQTYFWQSIGRWRRHPNPGRPYLHFFFDHGHVLQVAKSDLNWLICDVASRGDEGDRELALQMVFQLASGNIGRYGRELRAAVKDTAKLESVVSEALIQERWAWFNRFCFRWGTPGWKYRLDSLCAFVRSSKYSVKRKGARIWDWWDLRWNIRTLRKGIATTWLANLCMDATGFRFVPVDWKELAAIRGKRIANAVKSGCKAYWRTYRPPLPSEAKVNEIDPKTVVGLVGIDAALSDGELSCRDMSDEDARLVTRFAVHQMNGFPTWLQELGEIKPQSVTDVFTECVQGEWDYSVERSNVHGVITKLASMGGSLAKLARPAILRHLKEGDPVHPAILDAALSLALRTVCVPDTEFGQIALGRCTQLIVESESFASWVAVILQLDALEGMKILKERLRGCSNPDKVMLRLCNILNAGSRERLPMIALPDFRRPRALRCLIPLVYFYVRPMEDIDRAGKGPYSPNERDHAEEFRDSLLTWLTRCDDVDAVPVLNELLSESDLVDRHDWIRHLLEERMVKDADLPPWNPAEIRALPQMASQSKSPKPRPDILLVTVNEHETRALLQEVEAATKVPAKAVPLENRVYRNLGVLNGSSVFHALSEMGSGSVGAMQQTVDLAIRALNPGAVIAVGIAFGVDENRQAIGDVLLSKQLRPYDLQRVGPQITLRDDKPHASARLINYFEGFKQTAFQGVARSGVILTGNKLVDDVDYRDQLLSMEGEAIGGEMEGTGLYVSCNEHRIDWIVIKAICDWADGNKSVEKEKRQALAAKNAAQFVVQALQHATLKHRDT